MIDTVVPISARLIANRVSYKFKTAQIQTLVQRLANSVPIERN